MRSIPTLFGAALVTMLASALLCTATFADSKSVDYGDMRCGFLTKHSRHFDSYAVIWASGFLAGYRERGRDRGYLPNMATHTMPNALNDLGVLRDQLRAFCLGHRKQPLQAAIARVAIKSIWPMPTSPDVPDQRAPHTDSN